MFFRQAAKTESPVIKNSAFTSTYIADSSLFKSSPDPQMFGNPPNPRKESPQFQNWTHHNWLLSRFHFSFAEYSDYNRMGFSNMRVLNDDLVQPRYFFHEHGHRDANIITLVLSGLLQHTDNIAAGGRLETLERGSIQYLVAGTGIRHSEGNQDGEKPLRFLQLWFNPHRRNLRPDYGQLKNPDPSLRANRFFHMVSDSESKTPADTPVKIPTDVNLFVAEFTGEEEGKNKLEFPLSANRCVYAVCAEGEKIQATVTTAAQQQQEEGAPLKHVQLLSRHDAMTISANENCIVNFKPTDPANNKGFLVLIEMPIKD
jgi:redox-sensitive bicupin YhaK (pirin superfamily)